MARDTSRKIRAINESRTKNGKHVTRAIPYGYIHDPEDKQVWLLDEEAAPIVQRIFRGVIEGKGVQIIANELMSDRILTPAAHWHKINAGMKKPFSDPYKWSATTVTHILKKEEYMGWTILNKTIKETYKSKRKQRTFAMFMGYLSIEKALKAVLVCRQIQTEKWARGFKGHKLDYLADLEAENNNR